MTVTNVLIFINIVVYFVDQVLLVTTGSPAFIMQGAKVNELIILGQYWRFITPIFLHGGLVHLFVNTYSLYIIGPDVEAVFGRVKFLCIYLMAGILGNIASFAFCPNVSIGASGAIFGLLGALLYMSYTYRNIFSEAYAINIIVMIVINLVYGFFHVEIDNYAHIGGLIGGYISAASLGMSLDKAWTDKKVVALVLFMVLSVAGIFWGYAFPAMV
jgi:rhomboid protease GluP